MAYAPKGSDWVSRLPPGWMHIIQRMIQILLQLAQEPTGRSLQFLGSGPRSVPELSDPILENGILSRIPWIPSAPRVPNLFANPIFLVGRCRCWPCGGREGYILHVGGLVKSREAWGRKKRLMGHISKWPSLLSQLQKCIPPGPFC